jgi:hypothetical protein
VKVDGTARLGWGFRGGESFVFNREDPIIEPGSSEGRVVVSYPSGSSFFVAGYTEGAVVLRGTPAALDESVEEGRALLFAFDPNFRAYAEAGQRLFGNALLYPKTAPTPSAVRGLLPRPIDSTIQAGAKPPGRDTVVRVPADSEGALRTAAAAAGVPATGTITGGLDGTTLRVPNPGGLDAEQRAWVPLLLDSLQRAGVSPSLVVL